MEVSLFIVFHWVEILKRKHVVWLLQKGNSNFFSLGGCVCVCISSPAKSQTEFSKYRDINKKEGRVRHTHRCTCLRTALKWTINSSDRSTINKSGCLWRRTEKRGREQLLTSGLKRRKQGWAFSVIKSKLRKERRGNMCVVTEGVCACMCVCVCL